MFMVDFDTKLDKLLPRVQTFHRVSFDIPFCDRNRSPLICTFWSKTQRYNNSETDQIRNHFMFFVKVISHRREEGLWLL